jgi:prevent-host-death family protein
MVRFAPPDHPGNGMAGHRSGGGEPQRNGCRRRRRVPSIWRDVHPFDQTLLIRFEKATYFLEMTDHQDNLRSTVSSAEFQRNLGLYQDKALAEPVTVTKNGRERLVLLSVDEYHRLRNEAGRASSSPPPKHADTTALDVGSLIKALKHALKPHSATINTAFVYGSFAKGTSTPRSDIDLMVIGDDLDYAGLYAAAQHAELKLGRKVTPTLLAPDDWGRKAAQKGSFAQKLSLLPKIFNIGSERDLAVWQRKNSKTC